MEKFESVITKNSVMFYGKTVGYKLLCVIISFLNSMIINRCLGVALRGEYTTITNVASMLQLFMNLGIGTAYPAIKRRYPEKAKEVLATLVLILTVLYVCLLCLIIPLMTVEYKYILVIALLATIENLLIFIAIVENVSKKNIINLIVSIIYTVLLIGVFVLYRHNLHMILNAVVAQHIVFITTLVVIYRVTKFDVKFLNAHLLKEVFGIAIPGMLMNLLMYLNYHADVLFLSYLIDDSVEIGLYGTAVTLGNMMWIIPDAFKDILYNRAARKNNPKEIVVSIICNIAICLIVIVGFVFLGKGFLQLVYGIEFVGAYNISLLLFAGTLPMILYKLIHPIYIANGNTKKVVLLLLMAVVINIVGNVLLIPQYKGVGAAVSSVISYMICGCAFWRTFKQDYNISVIGIIKDIMRR